jgi:hypothetical protein
MLTNLFEEISIKYAKRLNKRNGGIRRAKKPNKKKANDAK